jgi:uncharacterized protein (UPF0305 family)
MTDEDKCARGAVLFYQYLNNTKKKNPQFKITDLVSLSHDFAMECGFDHPRCFVKYIEDHINELPINNLL